MAGETSPAATGGLDPALVAYYDRRAPEYDAVYQRDDAARQAELAAIAAALRRALAGRQVIELACGTGFWTALLAPVAAEIVALDAAPAMRAAARRRLAGWSKVEVRAGDAWRPEDALTDRGRGSVVFDGALTAFWLSHVPRARLGELLDGLHGCLAPGSVVFLADNVYVAGVGGELDEGGAGGEAGAGTGAAAAEAMIVDGPRPDTYKLRSLADGSRHRVLKNYLGPEELVACLGPRAVEVEIRVGECFWWCSYTLAAAPAGG